MRLICWVILTCIPGSLMACLEGVTIQPSGFKAEDLTIQRGMMTLKLETGNAVPVMFKGLRVGFLFAGKGSVQFKVTDPVAIQVTGYNVDKGSSLKIQSGPTLEDRFDRAMILGQEALRLIPSDLSQAVSLLDALRVMEDDFLVQPIRQPVGWIVPGIVNQTDELAVMFSGGKSDLLYFYDPVWEQEESLHALETRTQDHIAGRRLRFTNALVEQPLGRTRRDKVPPAAILTSLRYDLDFPDIDSFSGTFDESLVMQKGGLKALRLVVQSTSFYFTQQNAQVRRLHIDGVTTAAGDPLEFIHAEETLTVKLPRETPKGAKVDIRIIAHGDVWAPDPEVGTFIINSGYHWFPSPPGGHRAVEAVCSGRVKTRKPYRAIGSFEEMEFQEQDKIITMVGQSQRPCDMHALAVGKYFPTEIQVGESTVLIAPLTFENERAVKMLGNLTKAMMEIYNHYLGPFPFKRLTILEAKGMGWAQAPPGLIFASGEIFNSAKDDETKLYSKGANERFAHELAHQYFGHQVRLMQDPWLQEALSEYMAAICLETGMKKGLMKFLYMAWYDTAKPAATATTLYAYPWLDGYLAGNYRWGLVYCKGPVVIQALRDQVGEQAFWTILRSFLRSFPFKEVTTDDFAGLVNFVTKNDLKPFFDQYVYGFEMPPKSKAM